MVHSQEVQDCGVQVVHVNFVLDRAEAEIIRVARTPAPRERRRRPATS